jgi:superfamily II DNA or RNA helicase
MIYKDRAILCGGGRKGKGPKPPILKPGKPKKLRKWQSEAYRELLGHQYSILRSPVASGKTLLSKFLALHYLRTNPKGKVIVVVPEDLIGPNYVSESIRDPDGVIWKMFIPHQFDLTANKVAGCLRTLRDFLALKATEYSDRICVCTHAAICGLYTDLKRHERLDLFEGCMLVVDEAHRLYILGGKDRASSLGCVVRHFLTTPKKCLLMMSGSFFRSDGLVIIPPEFRDMFFSYEVPYDRYIADMYYLREFVTQFVFCEKSYEKEVEELLDEYPEDKWIFYLPTVSTPQEHMPKLQQVKKIIDSIGEVVKDDGLQMLVRRGDRLYRVINLVDETNRDKKKQLLHKRDKNNELVINQDKGALDIIISLNMVVEGFDWIHANHAVTLGVRNSERVVLQISGRVLRDVKEKPVARLTMVLPPTASSNEKTIQVLNDYCRGMMMSMLLFEVLRPTKIDIEVVGKGGTKHKESRAVRDLIPDEYREMILEKAMSLMASEDAYESYYDKMELWLRDLDVERPKDIAKGLWRMSSCKWAELRGLDISALSELDLVKADPLLGFRVAAKVYSARAGRELWPVVRTILCKAAGAMLPERAMAHVACIGVRSKSEYAVAAKAEGVLGRPLLSRHELDSILEGKKLEREDLDVRVPLLPISPERTYGLKWPGWPHFLGCGKRQPASLVAKPRANQKLHWVLKEVLWCHGPEDIVRFGTVSEISAFMDPTKYEALSNGTEAATLGQERRQRMKGLDATLGLQGARPAICKAGLLDGLRGISLQVPNELAKKHFLGEGTVLFVPKSNGSPMDGQFFPAKATLLEEIE